MRFNYWVDIDTHLYLDHEDFLNKGEDLYPITIGYPDPYSIDQLSNTYDLDLLLALL